MRMAASVNHGAPFIESAEERRHQISQTAQIFAAAEQSESILLDNNNWLIRPLLASEIETLKEPSCRCQSRDWSKLRLFLGNDASARLDQSHILRELVRDNTFEGIVVLGIDDTSKTDEGLPVGVFSNGLISNCVLEPNCRVYRNMCLCDTFVCHDALVSGCGDISARAGETHGYMQVTVGPESGGGRQLALTAESTMIDVCQSLMNGVSTAMTDRSNFISDYNIICSHAELRDTGTIENVYLASHSSIQAATSVKNAVLLPQAQIHNSCIATNVLLQWNASITDQSHVSDTLLMEHAHAGPQSVCASSVLGPDVHVSCGEVHASILGPNTNAHHQSLVISVLWPLGRGNVGYGANVGSNHTGRLPDQETCAGEGTFWGLSCVVKFPVNLLEAPYSIVAAGTTLIPQRVAMPFSLLVDGDGGGGLSQIVPGWVLQNSPYTLTRSELKFATRRKAQRHLFYTGWKIIRPDLVNYCIAARDALQSVSVKANVYKTDREIIGIGKNYLTEQGRQAGIAAYSSCIQRYALRGLLGRVQELRNSGRNIVSAMQLEMSRERMVPLPTANTLKAVSWPMLPWQTDASSTWNHQLSILLQEFPLANSTVTAAWVVRLLGELVKLEKEYAQRVSQSKKRDDVRGAKTIPGYADAHVSAEADATILHVKEEARKVEECVGTLVGELSSLETRSRL